eukprot:238809-Lingulodinium_polyedra.AAC.1
MGKEFLQIARQLGHQGISVAHYSFDRGGYSALQRLFKQHHQMLSLGFDASASGGKDSEALELLEWVCSSACGQHDCHNALK